MQYYFHLVVNNCNKHQLTCYMCMITDLHILVNDNLKGNTMHVNAVYHQSESVIQLELEWIQKAKTNPGDFAPLYTKYYSAIYKYIYQRMDDIDMAGDVTSQVFIKALQNIHKYEFRGVPFSSWLYRIAKSELNQAFRDNAALQTVNIDTQSIGHFIDDFEEEDLEEQKVKLKHALSQLKADELQMIELRFFEKRSFKEIGEIMDMTENNAKVKSFRTLEKLKKLFKI